MGKVEQEIRAGDKIVQDNKLVSQWLKNTTKGKHQAIRKNTVCEDLYWSKQGTADRNKNG